MENHTDACNRPVPDPVTGRLPTRLAKNPLMASGRSGTLASTSVREARTAMRARASEKRKPEDVPAGAAGPVRATPLDDALLAWCGEIKTRLAAAGPVRSGGNRARATARARLPWSRRDRAGVVLDDAGLRLQDLLARLCEAMSQAGWPVSGRPSFTTAQTRSGRHGAPPAARDRERSTGEGPAHVHSLPPSKVLNQVGRLLCEKILTPAQS